MINFTKIQFDTHLKRHGFFCIKLPSILLLIVELHVVSARAAPDARLIENAKEGRAQAQYILGYDYEIGRGVTQDIDAALNWYRRSAAQGFGPAMNAIGGIYADGEYVPRNEVEAARWFQRAADVGDADGLFNLGVSYQEGRGVNVNYPKALRLISEAGEKGHAKAVENLAYYYAGLDPDDKNIHDLNYSLAYCYFVISKILGEKTAQDHLAESAAWSRWLTNDQIREAQAAAVLWRPGHALPAAIKLEKETPFVVREGDAALRLNGPIKSGAYDLLKSNLIKNIKYIYVNSFGGDLIEGIKIANLIYKRKITTIVDGVCLSSCANYIFLFSDHRIILKDSLVCFHGGAPKSKESYKRLFEKA